MQRVMDTREADLTNPSVFNQFAEECWPVIFRSVLRIARTDYDKVEDLTQQTFLKAWTAANQFNHSVTPFTWIFSIMGNVIVSDYRMRTAKMRGTEPLSLDAPLSDYKSVARIKGDDQMDLASIIPSMDPGPDENAITAQYRDTVHAVVNRLPEEFRSVIALVDLEEMSYQDAGIALGIKEGTVKSRASRGRAQLAALMPPELRSAPGF